MVNSSQSMNPIKMSFGVWEVLKVARLHAKFDPIPPTFSLIYPEIGQNLVSEGLARQL